MSSARNIFFCLLLVVAMVIAGVIIQFLLAQSRNQTTINAEQVYALQQVHADTEAIVNELYQGNAESLQQLATHQKVMEKQLRQFNQQSGLLASEENRKTAAEDSLQLNHTWFALSQLMNKIVPLFPPLSAQRESQQQLLAWSSTMLTEADRLSSALGPGGRLQDGVSNTSNYASQVAELATIRTSITELQQSVRQMTALDIEPSRLSGNMQSQLQPIDDNVDRLLGRADQLLKGELSNLVDARDAFIAENARWSSALPQLDDAFLTRNAIQQRATDFSQQLSAKLRVERTRQHAKLLRALTYILPILAMVVLVVGGRRYIQSMTTHLAIAHSSMQNNAENARRSEHLQEQLTQAQQETDELKDDLQIQEQKVQEIADTAERYLQDIEAVNAQLESAESAVEEVRQQRNTMATKLLEAEALAEKYRLEMKTDSSRLDRVKYDLERQYEQISALERKNEQLSQELQASDAALEQQRIGDSRVTDELEEMRQLNEQLRSELQVHSATIDRMRQEAAENSEKLVELHAEKKQVQQDSKALQSLLDSQTAQLDALNKEKEYLGFEMEVQQQDLLSLVSQLQSAKDDRLFRLNDANENTGHIAQTVNILLDDREHDHAKLLSWVENIRQISEQLQQNYQSAIMGYQERDAELIKVNDLANQTGDLIHSLKKIALGGKASAEIVAETSAMTTQGLGSMNVISSSLDSCALSINAMLPALERLTENTQLMKDVVELLDTISEQAQSQKDHHDSSHDLDRVAAQDSVLSTKYDLFENFRMATHKISGLIADVLNDVEQLAKATQTSMNEIQDSSAHALAMNKLMKQINISQTQLHRLLQALRTQTELQTTVMQDVSSQFEQLSPLAEGGLSDQHDETHQQLEALSGELQLLVEQFKAH